MSQFYLYIGGVDYSDLLQTASINISEAIQANGQTLQCTVSAEQVGSRTTPTGGQEIRLLRDAVVEFAGRVATVAQNQPLTLANLEFKLDCVDYTADLDRSIYYILFDASSVGDMLRQLIGQVGLGFTSNNVVDGPTVNGQRMGYDLPSSFITTLAQGVEYQWYIDYNRDLNFFYILDRAAPITTIDFDTNTTDYNSLILEEHWEQVKNAIYLSGAKVRSHVLDSIAAQADGNQKFWPLNYPPWSVPTTTVKVDGVSYNVGLDSVDSQAGDGGAQTAQVYVCLDNWGIRFPDEAAPPKDATVEIAYNYTLEPIVLVEDEDSIALMAARENTATAPSNGRHEFRFDIPDLRVDDESMIYDYGNILLFRYSNVIFTGSFDSWTAGWKPGQAFTAQSAKRNLPLTQMYIHRVQKQAIGKLGRFHYNVEFSSVPFPI